MNDKPAAPGTADPRIEGVQQYLAREREAGRWIFSLSDRNIAEILAAADGYDTMRGPRIVQEFKL